MADIAAQPKRKAKTNRYLLENLLPDQPQEIISHVAWATVPPRTVTEADIGIDPYRFESVFAALPVIPSAGGPTTNEEEYNRPQNRRPVTVVSELQQQFNQDPKSAVQNNVGVHHRPEQLDSIEDDIIEIAAAHRRQNEVADKLWSNEDFELLELVKGLTRDTTLMNREVTSLNAEGRLMPTVGAGPRANGLVQRSATSDISARAGPTIRTERYLFNETEIGPLPENPTPAQIDALYRADAAKRDRLRILENVDLIMEQPQVTGELQMSSVMFGAMSETLARLVLRNRTKFAHKTKNHFYPDYAIKVLFAELIATMILFTKVIAPNQYYKVVDEPRRRGAVKSAIDNLDHSTVWDESRQCFALATTKQTERSQKNRRRLLRAAYTAALYDDDD